MELIISLGTILVVGYFFGLIAEKLNFPRVSAYLISGILFSHDLLGSKLYVNFEAWGDLTVNICLGLIAYIVGAKINFSELNKIRKIIFWGTFFESLLPILFVFTGLYFFSSLVLELSSHIAIVLASVASTTAPAATVAIIEQYKCKGKLTDTLLNIVALDDAAGIVFFTILTSFYFGGSLSVGTFIVFKEIFLAMLIGSIAGLMLSKFAHLSISDDFLFPLLVGLILVVEGLSIEFHTSSLLACILMGAISNNTFKNSEKVSLLLPIVHIEEFVFITFFTLAGTHFSVKYFQSNFIVILLYVILRASGKYIGAFIGTKLGGSDKIISKWIGLGLMPQAGVAIGLIFQVTQRAELNDLKTSLINIILGSTIIYETIGPFLSKHAFVKSGEIHS